jgi:hypothetical protein
MNERIGLHTWSASARRELEGALVCEMMLAHERTQFRMLGAHTGLYDSKDVGWNVAYVNLGFNE